MHRSQYLVPLTLILLAGCPTTSSDEVDPTRWLDVAASGRILVAPDGRAWGWPFDDPVDLPEQLPGDGFVEAIGYSAELGLTSTGELVLWDGVDPDRSPPSSGVRPPLHASQALCAVLDDRLSCWQCTAQPSACGDWMGEFTDYSIVPELSGLSPAGELVDVRTGDVLATPGPGVRLAVSLDNTCWLDEDRHPVCLGEDRYGVVDAPDTPLRSIAVGTGFAIGVEDDGTLTAWGCEDPNDRLQVDPRLCIVPDGVGYQRVWAEAATACAEEGDGSVTCWGSGAREFPAPNEM